MNYLQEQQLYNHHPPQEMEFCQPLQSSSFTLEITSVIKQQLLSVTVFYHTLLLGCKCHNYLLFIFIH